MELRDEFDQYQGHYNPMTKIFTQSQQIIHLNAIRINEDVIETLRLQGCEFIEAVTLKEFGSVEPYYIRYERFMEVANREWDHDKQRFDLVYNVPQERPEPDERREMRETLQP